MGLLLSILVVCVGVLEAVSCFRHIQDGYLPFWRRARPMLAERARRKPSVDEASSSSEEEISKILVNPVGGHNSRQDAHGYGLTPILTEHRRHTPIPFDEEPIKYVENNIDECFPCSGRDNPTEHFRPISPTDGDEVAEVPVELRCASDESSETVSELDELAVLTYDDLQNNNQIGFHSPEVVTSPLVEDSDVTRLGREALGSNPCLSVQASVTTNERIDGGEPNCTRIIETRNEATTLNHFNPVVDEYISPSTGDDIEVVELTSINLLSNDVAHHNVISSSCNGNQEAPKLPDIHANGNVAPALLDDIVEAERPTENAVCGNNLNQTEISTEPIECSSDQKHRTAAQFDTSSSNEQHVGDEHERHSTEEATQLEILSELHEDSLPPTEISKNVAIVDEKAEPNETYNVETSITNELSPEIAVTESSENLIISEKQPENVLQPPEKSVSESAEDLTISAKQSECVLQPPEKSVSDSAEILAFCEKQSESPDKHNGDVSSPHVSLLRCDLPPTPTPSSSSRPGTPSTPRKVKADISWPVFRPDAPVIKRPLVSIGLSKDDSIDEDLLLDSDDDVDNLPCQESHANDVNQTVASSTAVESAKHNSLSFTPSVPSSDVATLPDTFVPNQSENLTSPSNLSDSTPVPSSIPSCSSSFPSSQDLQPLTETSIQVEENTFVSSEIQPETDQRLVSSCEPEVTSYIPSQYDGTSPRVSVNETGITVIENYFSNSENLSDISTQATEEGKPHLSEESVGITETQGKEEESPVDNGRLVSLKDILEPHIDDDANCSGVLADKVATSNEKVLLVKSLKTLSQDSISKTEGSVDADQSTTKTSDDGERTTLSADVQDKVEHLSSDVVNKVDVVEDVLSNDALKAQETNTYVTKDTGSNESVDVVSKANESVDKTERGVPTISLEPDDVNDESSESVSLGRDITSKESSIKRRKSYRDKKRSVTPKSSTENIPEEPAAKSPSRRSEKTLSVDGVGVTDESAILVDADQSKAKALDDGERTKLSAEDQDKVECESVVDAAVLVASNEVAVLLSSDVANKVDEVEDVLSNDAAKALEANAYITKDLGSSESADVASKVDDKDEDDEDLPYDVEPDVVVHRRESATEAISNKELLPMEVLRSTEAAVFATKSHHEPKKRLKKPARADSFEEAKVGERSTQISAVERVRQGEGGVEVGERSTQISAVERVRQGEGGVEVSERSTQISAVERVGQSEGGVEVSERSTQISAVERLGQSEGGVEASERSTQISAVERVRQSEGGVEVGERSTQISAVERVGQSGGGVEASDDANPNDDDDAEEESSVDDSESASMKQPVQGAFWLIFSGEYTKAMSKDWHSGHFCCWQCDESLTGQRYVLRDDHPYCIKCYESVFANMCEECNKTIGIDSKDLSYKDKHWHEACFLCNKCRVSLVDKQFGSKADKIYCGNCYDSQFASRCDGCGEIFRAGTKKMEYKTRQWHEKCFCCCVCKSAIGTKSFIPREQEIYCATCYEEKFATRCVKCNKIITSGGVTYKNEPWHRECFTCTHCNTSLAGQRFTSRDEKPYCAECFGELFAKRCTACVKPITGIGGTRFISFEDRHWHNDCFICASCKTSLVGRGFITDADDIICPECAKQKLM